MAETNGHLIHTTKDGDRWDLIAWRYCGDVKQMKLLLEANREQWGDGLHVAPMVLPAGLDLVIPMIGPSYDDAGLPPWKRDNPDYGASS